MSVLGLKSESNLGVTAAMEGLFLIAKDVLDRKVAYPASTATVAVVAIRPLLRRNDDIIIIINERSLSLTSLV